MWITNGNLADVATVGADRRGDPRIPGPTDTPGSPPTRFTKVVAAGLGDLRSWCSTTSGCPPRRSCRTPRSRCPAVLPEQARFGIVFGFARRRRDSLETAIAYTQSRDVFDRPLSSYQLTREKLANMTVELGRGMLAGRPPRPDQKDAGGFGPSRSAWASSTMCASRWRSPGSADPAGRQRYHPEYSPLRHANNLESVLTYEGTPRCTCCRSVRPSPGRPRSLT